LLFVISWAFYIGFSYAGAIQPKWSGYMITGEVFAQGEQYESGLGDNIQTILLVGCDKRDTWEDSGRTDTIMLAFVDPKKDTVSILSIPRDTYVAIQGTDNKTKINHSYSYGGIPLTEQTIEDFLGIKTISVFPSGSKAGGKKPNENSLGIFMALKETLKYIGFSARYEI
jgi:anionic cell wall polymer biosynthesis LytR-Cps2A-Psr (LCP) family protein